MTAGTINVGRPRTSVLDSARVRLSAWMRRRSSTPSATDRPPVGADLVRAATDELTRDPHVRSVECRRIDVQGVQTVEILVAPADPQNAAAATRACEQMAHLITPLTHQEGLDVRFRLATAG
jgi:hypothetical protein